MRLATWNINSVRLRFPLLERLAKEYAPEVICLQETKTRDEFFPLLDVHGLGYPHCYIRGESGYNGVAILSKLPLKQERWQGFGGKEDCRHISAVLPGDIHLHNFYVPAGGDIPDAELNPKFGHKLQFLDDLKSWSLDRKEEKLILVGDLNVAPLEHDVWSHKQLLKIVSHTPAETERLVAIQETMGWVDCCREFVSHEEKLYSWWSYRAQDWRTSDRGRRLDHIWVSPALKTHLTHSMILKDARDWLQPSDHVPVIVDLAL